MHIQETRRTLHTLGTYSIHQCWELYIHYLSFFPIGAYAHLTEVETEAQRRELNCRSSHRQGAPYQPPLLLSEAAATPGGSATVLLSVGGDALPMGSPLLGWHQDSSPPEPTGPRILTFCLCRCLPPPQAELCPMKTNYKCRVFSTQCFQHLKGTIHRILPATQERKSLGEGKLRRSRRW